MIIKKNKVNKNYIIILKKDVNFKFNFSSMFILIENKVKSVA